MKKDIKHIFYANHISVKQKNAALSELREWKFFACFINSMRNQNSLREQKTCLLMFELKEITRPLELALATSLYLSHRKKYLHKNIKNAFTTKSRRQRGSLGKILINIFLPSSRHVTRMHTCSEKIQFSSSHSRHLMIHGAKAFFIKSD